MGAGLGGGQVLVDDVGVRGAVHVGAREAYHALLDEVFGNLALLLAVGLGQAEDVDLEHQAGVVQVDVAFLLVGPVEIALRMGKNGAEALDLQVEHELVEVPRLLYEGIFDEQVVAGQRHQIALSEYAAEEVVDAVFGRVAHLDAVAACVELGLELGHGGLYSLGRVLESVLGDVRRGEDALDAPLLHAFDKVARSLCVGRAVVHSRHDVAVDVGIEAELYRLLGFAAEKIEHTSKSD